MRRVLLIGSNPSEKSSDNSPFHPSTRSRTTIDEWFRDMDIEICFDNVCHRTRSGNRPLRMSEIRAALPALNERIRRHGDNCKVVALGRTAEKALSMLGVEHFTAPHPSGANRKLNKNVWVQRMIQCLHKYIMENKCKDQSILEFLIPEDPQLLKQWESKINQEEQEHIS